MAPIYKRGSRGDIVKLIQKTLHLYPDGMFGPLTEEAVRMFQSEHGLKPDGIVGSATLARLIPMRFKHSRREITEIIVHCTATPEGREHTVDDIRRWHRQQGWSDIGYHYVVYLDGSVHEGRDVDVTGAHCAGHNSHSIGVVYVGGCNRDGKTAKDTRTDEQKFGLLSVLLDLRMMYPDAKIYGHRDFDKGKACPSFDARREYENI